VAPSTKEQAANLDSYYTIQPMGKLVFHEINQSNKYKYLSEKSEKLIPPFLTAKHVPQSHSAETGK
jgi:hypothetical protein